MAVTTTKLAGGWDFSSSERRRPYSSMTNLAGAPDDCTPRDSRDAHLKKYPPLPNVGRRRGSLLVSSARDSNSLPSFSKKSIGKRRSNSCRDDVNKVPKTPTEGFVFPPANGDIYQLLLEEEDGAGRKSTAVFSPYSPLPAIGASQEDNMKNEADAGLPNTSYLYDPSKEPKAMPRLLRERTYDVLEPRFVKGPASDRTRDVGKDAGAPSGEQASPGPSPGPARMHDAGPPDRRRAEAMDTDEDLPLFRMSSSSILFGPRLEGAAVLRVQPEMIDDVEVPTSPPDMDDEDFEPVAAAEQSDLRALRASPAPAAIYAGNSLSDSGRRGSDSCRATPTADTPTPDATRMRPSRSLQSLKTDYKGKLKKFWSKF